MGGFVPNWPLEHYAAKGWFEPRVSDAALGTRGSIAQGLEFAKSAAKDNVLDLLGAKLRLRVQAFESRFFDLWYRCRFLL